MRKQPESEAVYIAFPRLPPREAFPRAFEGRHWASRSGIKAEMKLEARLLARQQHAIPETPFEYAHITWTFQSPRGNFDGDNVLAAAKGWLDGLKAAGVIKNDTLARVSHTIRWERAGQERTHLKIEEVLR